MDRKQPVPAAVKFQTSGKLEPINYDWTHILALCQEAVKTEKQYVVLPVELPYNVKKFKAKMVKEKGAPRGPIIRDEQRVVEKYYPYAAVRFEVHELATFAAKKFNEVPIEELADMLSEDLPEEFEPYWPEGTET